LGLAFVSSVSLSTLGVVDHFHVLLICVSSDFLGFRHERVATVGKVYMECNAWFR
jgi:hypothetical protein